VNARKLSLLVACCGVAVGICACDRSAISSVGVAPETLTPISRVYVVESNEVIEHGQFEDGSVGYTPTGWIVVSPSSSATATAAGPQR
jgi:hypothetical protein